MSNFRYWAIALGLIFWAAISGCAGGTSGTGGTGSTQFTGKIVSENNEPVVGATVSLLETGDATQTDTQGVFVLIAEEVGNSATLLVETGTTQAQTVLEGIEPDTAEVELDLSLDNDRQVVEVNSRRDKRRTPRPKPTAIPEPTPTVEASGTIPPVVEPVPTVTGTPGPIETPVISPTPNSGKQADNIIVGTIRSEFDPSSLSLRTNRQQVQVDKDGSFSIKTSVSSRITLAVEKGVARYKLKLPAIAKQPARISMEIKVVELIRTPTPTPEVPDGGSEPMPATPRIRATITSISSAPLEASPSFTFLPLPQ